MTWVDRKIAHASITGIHREYGRREPVFHWRCAGWINRKEINSLSWFLEGFPKMISRKHAIIYRKEVQVLRDKQGTNYVNSIKFRWGDCSKVESTYFATRKNVIPNSHLHSHQTQTRIEKGRSPGRHLVWYLECIEKCSIEPSLESDRTEKSRTFWRWILTP